jgi:hypothetical protein
VIIRVLDGEGLVRSRRHLDVSSTEILEETWRRDGTIEQVQGSGPAGPWSEQHDRQGTLLMIEESLGDGATCTLQIEDGKASNAWVTEANGTVSHMGEGRSQDRRVAECPAWTRHPELTK